MSKELKAFETALLAKKRATMNTEELIGMECVASLEAPFTEEQRQRIGTVLGVEGTQAHVEWRDRHGWKTRVWLPLSWIHCS